MKIRIGDKIVYTPWTGPDQTTTIKGIEICRRNEKYGISVTNCDTREHENGVLDLDNGHWCYFDQIKEVIK